MVSTLQSYQLMTTTSSKKLSKFILLLLLITLVLSQSIKVSDEDDHDHDDDHDDHDDHMIEIPARWGFGFLAGLGISLIGFGTALAIVLCKKLTSDTCFEMTIKFLFSLAFGALIGDVLIHILPQAFKSQETDSRIVAGIFISSIALFLIIERLFESCGVTHSHWHGQSDHSHEEGSRKVYNEDENGKTKKENSIRVEQLKSTSILLKDKSDKNKTNKLKNQTSIVGHEDHEVAETGRTTDQNQEEKSCWENLKGKNSAGYLNLLGSLVHNFVDGLALGIAFATGDSKIFIPVLIAIIAHEIPRQMGDVAILLKSQFNPTQTILCNGFVNLISLVGLFIGLGIIHLSNAVKLYLLVFVAGNFIFISADIWRNLFKNKGFLKNFVEFIGFGIGVAAMYLILLLESGEDGHAH